MSADPFDSIIGHSRAAQAIRSFGRRAASVEAPVLLLGESGTGKGVLARAIHQASARSARPFVAINCAAIPDTLFESEFFGHVRGAFTGAQYTHKGLFEQAHTGTLFLDEIGELPMAAQAKLLTAIEDRVIRRVGAERAAAVDVRIIAATACDLPARVHEKTFRTDLYHRLSILCFEIPPLRERTNDIPLIAEYILDSLAVRYHISKVPRLPIDTSSLLQTHTWPGNVRELTNTIERALLLQQDEEITPANVYIMPSQTRATRRDDVTLGARYSFPGNSDQESAHIREALLRCRGNKTRAAELLGMSRSTLANKLRLIECE